MEIIDIHTHGIGGFDTKTSDETEILKMAEVHGSFGVSGIIPTIYPAPINIMRENISAVKRAMERQKTGARILGVNLEGPFLNPARCGALHPASFIKPDEYNLQKLIAGFEDIVKIITIAPELDGALLLIRKLSEMGIAASMGHSDATYPEAEAGFKAGAKGITHIFNAMRPFHHREPGLSGFGLLNKDIYIEVICDPFHLHPKTIGLIFRMKNPEKIIIVSDTVKGSMTVAVPPPGRLLGGSMPVTDVVERLVGIGFEREMLVQCISENPVRYLK